MTTLIESNFLSPDQVKYFQSIGVDFGDTLHVWRKKLTGQNLGEVVNKSEYIFGLSGSIITRGFETYETLPAPDINDLLGILPPQVPVDEFWESRGAYSVLTIKDRKANYITYERNYEGEEIAVAGYLIDEGSLFKSLTKVFEIYIKNKL